MNDPVRGAVLRCDLTYVTLAFMSTPEQQRERRKNATPEQRAIWAEKQRAWRAANPGKSAEYQRKSRAANPEQVRETARERYRNATPEQRAKRRETASRYRAAHRDKINVRQSESQQPSYIRARRHGLLPEQVAAMFAMQGGKCYLCGELLTSGARRNPNDVFAVEHDHRCSCPVGTSCTVCRRGLACHRCNMLIGLADDDPGKLRRIADALEAARSAVTMRLALAPQQLSLDEVGLTRT